jgi:hypothetical protein
LNQIDIYSNMRINKYLILRTLRKCYSNISHPISTKPVCERDPNIVSETIYKALTAHSPCMIARLGSTELSTLVNYLGITKGKRSISGYVTGKEAPWWWQENLIKQMEQWSGFFPSNETSLEVFCELTLKDIPQIDILGSWLPLETHIQDLLPSHHQKIWRIFIDPFWSANPWTKALEGKKVLVVHPFEEIIRSQYMERREKLFDNPNVLPKFDLKVLKAVQSLGGDSNGFSDWFEALDYMKGEIDKIDFDICLLGCGAYGLPLAAHVKSIGKKAVHWGGSLQLLFGIIGRRWESPSYGDNAKGIAPHIDYPGLINENWIRPEAYKTKNSANVEGACYW